VGAVTIETTFGGALGDDPASDERDKYWKSAKADQLEQLTSGITDSGAELRRRTQRVLRATRGAPPGPYCAVSALDSVASSWNIYAGDPGYRDAREQVRHIRRFQRQHDLRESEF
jgi:hypothetical protein